MFPCGSSLGLCRVKNPLSSLLQRGGDVLQQSWPTVDSQYLDVPDFVEVTVLVGSKLFLLTDNSPQLHWVTRWQLELHECSLSERAVKQKQQFYVFTFLELIMAFSWAPTPHLLQTGIGVCLLSSSCLFTQTLLVITFTVCNFQESLWLSCVSALGVCTCVYVCIYVSACHYISKWTN